MLVLFQVSGRGRTSGVDLAELSGENAALFEIRDARVARFVGYPDYASAFADLGIGPDADAQSS